MSVKGQTVKIPENYVRACEAHFDGPLPYTGLSDFVRAAIRHYLDELKMNEINSIVADWVRKR